jgi:predicted nucleic acid-binding protein
MNPEKNQIVIYWDASAILSALIKDAHSEEAQQWANKEGPHLLSSLAYGEVLAVLSRMRRQRLMADLLVEAALQTFESGPWRRLNSGPEWNLMAALSKKWSLRGADLWHLSAAKSACEQLPELKLLTYDTTLKDAADGEGIGLIPLLQANGDLI